MMELGLDVFKNQGPAFWAAAAAIALGLTILAVCGFVYFRGILSRTLTAGRGARKAPAARIVRPATAEPAPIASVPGPDALPAAASAPGTFRESDLSAVLARLQAAAERLEGLRSLSQSPLKDTAADVEYVFKKGVG